MTNEKTAATSIPEYFAGQVIFITGGAGFMGKVLVEKILRCCPDVEKIYLLIRPKRQDSIQKRWEEVTKLPLFDILRSTNPNSLTKVHLVKGDLSSENLGISDEDLQILTENVTIIYHAAAMIQFVDSIHEVLINNTNATHLLLNIAMRMKNLQLFVYVSTAFSNMNLPCQEVEERVLPACQDWKVILKMLKTDPLGLSALKEKLLCGHPNPYTWSKSLAEQIVNEYKDHFPCIIVRPSIVIHTFKDPFEGWADILCSPTAISLAVVLGVIRVIYTGMDSYQDYLPVDVAINAMLVCAWKKSKESHRGSVDVYNCGVAKDLPVTTKDLLAHGKNIMMEMPSKNIVWASHAVCTTNDHLFNLLFIVLQIIPSAILDLGLLLTGNKPMLLKLSRKASNVRRILKSFSTKQLDFPNQKFKELDKCLSEEDKKWFFVNVEGQTAFAQIKAGYHAAIKYYLKEDLSPVIIKKNTRRLFWIDVLDKCLIYTFYAVTAGLLLNFIGSFEIIKRGVA